MFKINEYFNGDVVSMSLNGAEGKATVGVIQGEMYGRYSISLPI